MSIKIKKLKENIINMYAEEGENWVKGIPYFVNEVVKKI